MIGNPFSFQKSRLAFLITSFVIIAVLASSGIAYSVISAESDDYAYGWRVLSWVVIVVSVPTLIFCADHVALSYSAHRRRFSIPTPKSKRGKTAFYSICLLLWMFLAAASFVMLLGAGSLHDAVRFCLWIFIACFSLTKMSFLSGDYKKYLET